MMPAARQIWAVSRTFGLIQLAAGVIFPLEGVFTFTFRLGFLAFGFRFLVFRLGFVFLGLGLFGEGDVAFLGRVGP